MVGHKSVMVGAVCLVALSWVSIGRHQGKSVAAESDTKALFSTTYRVLDLPIWTVKSDQDRSVPHQDPSILIALLKAKIGDDYWDDSHSISHYDQNVSLVVSTTKENHAVIRKTLDDLRVERFKRSPEFQGSTR